MDILYQAAKKFESLLSIEYIFTMGRKGKKHEIHLIFDKTDFAHLAGLHKLTDIAILKNPANKIFDSIINKELTFEMINKSKFLQSAIERLTIIEHFDFIFTQQNSHFKWVKPSNDYSRIDCDFLIYFFYEDFESSTEIEGYLFLEKYRKKNNHLCKSTFQKTDTAYEKNQRKMTLLKTVKKDKIENSEKTKFLNPIYKE